MLTNTEVLEYTSTLEKIRFQLITDKPIYNIGDSIQVKGTITNIGSEIYTYYGSSTCDNSLYFLISNKNSGEELQGKGSIQPSVCTEDYVEFNLKPNDVIETKAVFSAFREKGVYTLLGRYGNISLSIPIIVQ